MALPLAVIGDELIRREGNTSRVNSCVSGQSLDRLPLREQVVASSANNVQHNVALFDTLEHLQHLRVSQLLSCLPVNEQNLVA